MFPIIPKIPATREFTPPRLYLRSSYPTIGYYHGNCHAGLKPSARGTNVGNLHVETNRPSARAKSTSGTGEPTTAGLSGPTLAGKRSCTRGRRWCRIAARPGAVSSFGLGGPCRSIPLFRADRPLSFGKAVCRSGAGKAVSALLAILPQVSEEWHGHLPNGTSAALANLAASYHDALALSALEALANAGDGSAAHAVKCLMERAASDRVRERATTLLPILIGRAAHKMAQSTLLRPSSYNTTEHLVRPVYSGDPDVTHLLRASQSESQDASRAITENIRLSNSVVIHNSL